MKIIFSTFLMLTLYGCGQWKEVQIPYESEKYCETLHVHFYDHNTCEWSCLDMDEGIYCVDDTLNLRVKKNNLGEVKKVKILK